MPTSNTLPVARRNVRIATLCMLPLACASLTPALAQIRTDGTLGGPAVALAGPNFLIGQALGKLSGSNLFHSFDVFNVGSTESATFMTTTPGLANVISRVTGGTASQINGMVRLTSAPDTAPNFFFINPAGVVFGSGAQIDVPAGFHVSTANYLKFPDGNFYADPNAASTLSSAAPEAFGFLGTTRATIAIKDGAALQTTSPDADQPIGIVASDIAIDSASVQTGGSDVRLVAVGSGVQEVGVTGALPPAFGNLSVRNGAFVSTQAADDSHGGTMLVSAGNVTIDGRATGFGALPSSSGGAGNLIVKVTGDLAISNQGAIRSDAGSVDVSVQGRLSLNGGLIDSASIDSEHAGSVSVRAGDIAMDGQGRLGGSAISTSTRTGNAGNAGSIDVTASGTLSIVNGALIRSDTSGSGNAGTVSVKAGDIVIDGKAIGAEISTSSFGDGKAGEVVVTAVGTLSIADGKISSDSFLSGGAGTVKVSAGDIFMDGHHPGVVTTISSVSVHGGGNAGTVDVSARGLLSIVNGATIDSSALESTGSAGSVSVSAGTISVDSKGLIGASAGPISTGQTGTVTVRASEGITLANGAAFSISNAAKLEEPGSVHPTLLTVTAPTITLSNGGQFTAAASGNTAASGIQVSFGRQMTVSNASIATTAKLGNGGSIAVNGTGNLVLQNGQITTSVAGTRGNGGDISVHTPILVMQTGFIQANTAAPEATGGNVNIEVGTLLPSGGTLFVGGATDYTFAPNVFGFNVIQAAAPTGVSGTILISTPVLDITGSLSALPEKVVDSGGLGRTHCAIAGGSSLAQVGRGGMPRAATRLLWASRLFDLDATPPPGSPMVGAPFPPFGGARAGSKSTPCWS